MTTTKTTQNRITEVKLTLQPDGSWLIEVKKEFAPEHGGGSQVFTADERYYQIHRALDVAREMVTVSPAYRTEEVTA
jgi:hypothetical protein